MNPYQQPTPVCPHCGHAVSYDEMPGVDSCLFDLAPTEGSACIDCPVCDKAYWVKGGYTPHYTTAFSEEELQ